MGIWIWLNANSAGVTAVATTVYAVLTLGLWIVTWLNTRRTRELARLSRDTLKLQVLAHHVESSEKITSQLASGDLPSKFAKLALKHYGNLLQRAFPEQYTEIQRINEELLDEMLKTYGVKDQPPHGEPCQQRTSI